MSPGVRLHEDPLICPVGEAVLHFARQILRRNLVGAEEDISISHDGDQQGIFLVGVGHGRRVVDLGHVDADSVLQHGRDYHEDNQQYQHHVHHGSDVDIGADLGSFISLC